MAVNPMQRKARNSFLLGVIVTLLISSIAIVILFLQLSNKDKALKAEIGAKQSVYLLNQDVKSGQVLTQDMFSLELINIAEVPSNATALSSVIDTWFLQTKDGEMVCRDKDGLYLKTSDSIIEVYQENGGYYRLENGEHESISIRNSPYEDDEGMYVIDTNGIDTTTRVYEESTGQFYIYKIDEQNKSRVKTYLEINNVPVIAKVNMYANTVITPELVVQSDAVVTKDVRREEYNMIVLPMDLMTGDYIDIRLLLPTGQNVIVVSKKQVEVPQNADGSYVADTIWAELREDEILSISSAIVEAYTVPGSKLYAVKYAEPGMQDAAVPTYTPNSAVTALIQSNPNIVETASKELAARYSDTSKNIRNEYIQSEINKVQTPESNIQSGMDESITNGENARREYLESLGY